VGPRSDKYEDISNSLGGLPSTEKGVKNKEDKRLLAFVAPERQLARMVPFTAAAT
jgi:hypothetical protein